MKFLASSNKKALLPVVLVFTFVSLFFIFKLSSKRYGLNVGNHPEASIMIENTAMVESMTMTKEEWESCLSPGHTPSEYLSIVIVTRVDNYAG